MTSVQIPARYKHAAIAHIMIGDATAPFSTPASLGASSVGLHVYINNVDAFTEHAKKSGVEELQPPQDMCYGARQSMVQDPYGHIWIFLTQTEDLSTQEIEQRARMLFK